MDIGACLGLLIGAGADANAKDNEGWTAAMGAVVNGHGHRLRVLIAGGADLEAKSSNGWTAAMHAYFEGHTVLAAFIEGVLVRSEAAELDRQWSEGAPGASRGRGSLRV